MNDKFLKKAREVTLIRSWIIAVIVSAVGLVLVVSASDTWAVVWQQLGSSLLVGGVIWFAWEFLGKRAFAEELHAMTKLSSDVAEAGLDRVFSTFKSHDLDWPHLFRHSDKLDIFVSYAYTWRNEREPLLKEMMSRPGARIRVVLPDSDDKTTLNNLCLAFGYDEPKLKSSIADAIEFYKKLGESAQGKGATVQVYVAPRNTLISWYQFDDHAVLALYSHRGKEPVPTFVCKSDGFLYAFLKNDYDELVRVGRKVGEYGKPVVAA